MRKLKEQEDRDMIDDSLRRAWHVDTTVYKKSSWIIFMMAYEYLGKDPLKVLWVENKALLKIKKHYKQLDKLKKIHCGC